MPVRVMGMIGGISWESSAVYYAAVNRGVQQRLGGVHSARTLMYSVEFNEMKNLQHRGQWGEAAKILIDAARRLERGGAEFFLLCCNTMHCVAGEMSAAVQIPFIHIVDPTGEQIRAKKLRRVGLLGTRFTMEQDFFKERLAELYGVDVVVPDEQDRAIVHEIIYSELVRGEVNARSRQQYNDVIGRLIAHGAEGVILGCTEITLLIKPDEVPIPVFDTTLLHAEAAVSEALRGVTAHSPAAECAVLDVSGMTRVPSLFGNPS